jgi:hypothetical protein
MVLDVGVDEHGVGVELVEGLIEVREEELRVEMELRGVRGYERGIGFDDAYQLDVLVFRQRAEESTRVVMDQACDDHPHGRAGGYGAKRIATEKRKYKDQGWRCESRFQEHGETFLFAAGF